MTTPWHQVGSEQMWQRQYCGCWLRVWQCRYGLRCSVGGHQPSPTSIWYHLADAQAAAERMAHEEAEICNIPRLKDAPASADSDS